MNGLGPRCLAGSLFDPSLLLWVLLYLVQDRSQKVLTSPLFPLFALCELPWPVWRVKVYSLVVARRSFDGLAAGCAIGCVLMVLSLSRDLLRLDDALGSCGVSVTDVPRSRVLE